MHSMNYTQNNEDNTLFLCFNSKGKWTILIVSFDNIINTGDDINGIKKLGQDLSKHFDVKDLGRLRYFLGIEVVSLNKELYSHNTSMFWTYQEKSE